MMFLEFFIWGAWLPPIFNYLARLNADGNADGTFDPADADAGIDFHQAGMDGESGEIRALRIYDRWAQGTGSPVRQALAQRWQRLVEFTTGGDPEMAQAIKRHWEEEGDKLVAQYGAEYDSRRANPAHEMLTDF